MNQFNTNSKSNMQIKINRIFFLKKRSNDRSSISIDINQTLAINADRYMEHKKKLKRYTILWGNKVDVAVTERTSSGWITADADGSKAFKVWKIIKKLSIGNIVVKITNVQWWWRCKDSRRNRHWRRQQNSKCLEKEEKKKSKAFRIEIGVFA